MDEEVGTLRRVDVEAVGTIGFVMPPILWPHLAVSMETALKVHCAPMFSEKLSGGCART